VTLLAFAAVLFLAGCQHFHLFTVQYQPQIDKQETTATQPSVPVSSEPTVSDLVREALR